MTVPIDLPAGLTARPAQHGDLPAMHALVAAYEQRLLGEVMLDLEDLESDWERPSFSPERDSLVVLDGDRLVACAEVFRARRASATVHPDHWGRGIGTALLDWCTRVSAATGGEQVGQTVPDADEAAVALFRARGWSPLWTSWVLELPPGQEISQRPVPPGYARRTFRPGQDEQAAYDVVERAFGEWPDREATSYGDWAAQVLARPAYGRAREHGAQRGELSTDSRTGALSLYERLGMRVRSAFTQWAGPAQPRTSSTTETTTP